MNFHIGPKVPRARPIANQGLTQNVQLFKGTLVLHVACAWRLDSPTEVVCGSGDDNANDGPMVEGLNRLLGSRVTAIEALPPAWDMKVTFDNRLTLRIFCDQTDENDGYGNYLVNLPHASYNVGTRGLVVSRLLDDGVEAQPNGNAQ